MYNFATAVSFAGKIFAESWKTANNKKSSTRENVEPTRYSSDRSKSLGRLEIVLQDDLT